MSTELLPANLAPGLVPTGFASSVLARAADVDDPALLWDTATTCAALAQKWNGHGREKSEIKTAQMYVEIELGQRLGPAPGGGGDRRSLDAASNPHADLVPRLVCPNCNGGGRGSLGKCSKCDGTGRVDLIAPQRVAELRRFFGHRDLLVEAARTVLAVLTATDETEADVLALLQRTVEESPSIPVEGFAIVVDALLQLIEGELGHKPREVLDRLARFLAS